MNYEKTYMGRPVLDITPGAPVVYMQFRDTILTLSSIRDIEMYRNLGSPDELRIVCDAIAGEHIYPTMLNDVRIYNPAIAPKVKAMFQFPEIKNVIFNDPATIVFWADGSKTVVKCQDDDIFDPEKGLAMAISKKVLGNKSNFNNEFKKWLPEEPSISLSTPVEYTLNLNVDPKVFKDAFTKFGCSWNNKWEIKKNNAQTERSESDDED